ncbi:MAG: hypothetical protein CMN78_00975 [Spirochaetales bacterium]|nr:hypothetical protein [Spirochaetales bacterium]
MSERSQKHSKLAYLFICSGAFLIISGPITAFLARDTFARYGVESFVELWWGLGGLVLLFYATALPLGAILLAAGIVRSSLSQHRRGWVFVPLFAVHLIYFAWHGIFVFRYIRAPFLLFTFAGFIVLVLFGAVTWYWWHTRREALPTQLISIDLLYCAMICFLNAAWQICGLVGAPGFAGVPALSVKLSNQSFITGQLVAIMFFIICGFGCALLGFRRLAFNKK